MKILTIPARLRLTKGIVLMLNAIEINRNTIDSTSIPVDLEQTIRQESLLGSALFSARVEGNSTRPDQLAKLNKIFRGNRNLREIGNLNRAYNYIWNKRNYRSPFSKNEILNWHEMLMRGVIGEGCLGMFREGEEGIFDSLGNAIYHAPPARYVVSLMDDLIKYLNRKGDHISPIKAILAHLAIEKIHPFVDGSGRVGRLLQFAVLMTHGYGMKGLANVEEYVDKNKQLYYRAIEEAIGKDATVFVELMLDLLVKATNEAKEKILLRVRDFNSLDILPPRRKEIVLVVQDHKIVSLDFIHRRFFGISPRLLSYDLKYLIDNGYIVKIGKTRGALYAPKP